VLVTAAQVRAAITGRTRYRVVKADPQRFSLGLAYPAHDLDGHSEGMTADEVERVCWGYLSDGREIGLQHADGTLGHATVVENYIYRGPDWHVPGVDGAEQVIRAGDWMLGVIWDVATWPRVLAGGIGWSIDGLGLRRPVRRSQLEVPRG